MKKKWKKLIGIMLGLVMVLGMSATAFANGDTTNPDTTGSGSSVTYELYQIFTGDFANVTTGEGDNQVTNKVLSNVKWGQNGTGYNDDATEQARVSDDILDNLAALAGRIDSEILDGYTDANGNEVKGIKDYWNESSTAYKADITADEKTNTITLTDLPAGYYLLKNAGAVTGDAAATLYVVEVTDGTLTATLKNDTPTVDKKIVEDDEEVEVNEASIGEKVNYEITGTLPSKFDDYYTYYYKFTDTLSAGLTYNGDMKVFVVNGENEEEVTNYFYIGATENSETGETTIIVSIADLVALNYLDDVDVHANTTILLTYSATLNGNAVIGSDEEGVGNPNKVKLEYSNDPNNSGSGKTEEPPEKPENPPTSDNPTGETPEKEVKTFTTELSILKTDENGNVLQGVEFTLTGNGVIKEVTVEEEFEEDANGGTYFLLKDGTYTLTEPTESQSDNDGNVIEEGNSEAYEQDQDGNYIKYSIKTTITVKDLTEGTEESVTVGVNKAGHAIFTGLGAGEYTLTETKTPEGYNTIDPIDFTISFDETTNEFSVNVDRNKIMRVDNNTFKAEIVNTTGTILPSTGGIGTTIFYVVGMVIIIAACVLLITRRRAKK